MSYADYFFSGDDRPKKKKSKKTGYAIVNGRAYPLGKGSKPKKKRSSQPHDEFGGYSGGSLLNVGNFGGERHSVRKQPQGNSLGEYVQTRKNLYAMGKNVYHSPLVQFTKKKIGQKLQERGVENEGRKIKEFGMVRPVYPGGKQKTGLGFHLPVKSNKHLVKMEDIFKQ